MNDLYWREEVKRSMSLLSFGGVCMFHSGPFFLFGIGRLGKAFSGMFYQRWILVSRSGVKAIFYSWWSFLFCKCVTDDKKKPQFCSFCLQLWFEEPVQNGVEDLLSLAKIWPLASDCIMRNPGLCLPESKHAINNQLWGQWLATI